MISSTEMAVVDANAEALGVPRKQLMESSGNAVARAVRTIADPGASVVFVCGRGNNGGDAFVAARFLGGYDVTVQLLGRPETISTEIARENWTALERSEIGTRTVRDSTAFDPGDPDVVVDAMLGTGVAGALREPEATAAGRINAADATVLSVDVPSGIDADTGGSVGVAVEADRVVTFHDDKPGLREVDADVTVADIGIPAAAERVVGRGDLLRLSRDPTAHKGEFGRVLVVGGGPYTGAPALAARAALRGGADVSYVACPDSIAGTVQSYGEDLIVRPQNGDRIAPETVPALLDLAAETDCVVLGPGLGDDDGTRKAVTGFLESYDGIAVVDADALSAVRDADTGATLICTPHGGEFEAMGGTSATDPEERGKRVAALADELGATILSKGAVDVISDGTRTRHNRTGTPGMTVGGTGDVLAGVTGALACVLDPIHAAAVGAYANGRAGEIVAEEYGHGLVATDLLGALPAALWPDTGE